MNEEQTYSLEFDEYGARLMQKCIDHYLERWPGGDPEEQEALWELQRIIYSIVLEYEYNKN